ncbi:polysaccharide lyase 6 family protein [Chitinophaga pendula]|uniref:polysaccharide lyase 6 family protein n=1 Tax=Chitinophaga TaxID=79328 RepID=UPI000BB04A3F|nr:MULTISPECIES: polysaccharide lyase 6 family protein [Chitinophaga]ASZ14165.1 hypothetical protein CK934_26050 [Chitinophaga sp. MD30]UCJ08200.1 polysaccharide lyase 6 family protein [Chitinophaga pendula]
MRSTAVPYTSHFSCRWQRIASLILLIICSLATTTTARQAAAIAVHSLPELQEAVNKATPGAIIILADGNYTATTDININAQGTAAQPITIRAATNGKAFITGEGGFHLTAPASHLVIQGFFFKHTSSRTRTDAGTSFCRFLQNTFETTGDGENLLINGNDHQVAYNTFQHKDAMGRFIAIRGTGSQIAERLWIHHNYFFDHKRQKANGAESLQFGLSGFSLSTSNSVVEYNLFEDCDGENELISIKASGITLRYNTIRNCPAHFTLRHGNHNTVYGNYFFNTPGLRIFGDDHTIHSNYFEQCSPAINIGNGGAEVADGAPLTSHDRPDRVLIAFNTLINNKQNIVQQPRNNGIGATQITISHNIISGGPVAAKLAGPLTGTIWEDNTLVQVNDPGDMPAGAYITGTPKLIADKKGIWRLQKSYPAFIKDTAILLLIPFDMDGQPRKAPLDAGADQFSQAAATAWPLTKEQTGAQAVQPRSSTR